MADATNKPVIFLAFANDRDDNVGYLRNLPNEARRLRDALDSAEQAGLCEVVVRSNSTATDIFKVFQDPKYRNRIAIFHYGGHANGYQLLLESAAGQSAAADAGGLAKFLGHQRGLQLVFLNGCSTHQQTQGLLDNNVLAVVSTSQAISDRVATDFSCQIYQGLAGGAGLLKAFNEAEAAVQMTEGGDTRALYFGDPKNVSGSFDADRWPWMLYFREGAEHVGAWNLPNAVDDPLFGLPALPEQDLPDSPYRHLKWFTHQDAEVFFGRSHQVRDLYDRLTAPRTAPIVLFYGQSGVGKSSLLDAGLFPRLEHDHEVRYLRRRESGLLDTLLSAFGSVASEVSAGDAWRVKEEKLERPLVVVLDQVEEAYTRPNPNLLDEVEQFLRVLQETFEDSARRPRGKLVLGFRKEWLAEIEARLTDHELARTRVFLEPLDRRGIIEVVEGPARSERLREQYRLTVEENIAEIIADDLTADRDSAIAPTLQILLTKMWTKATEANDEQPTFSEDLYLTLKNDGILLRDFLNQQIAAFRQKYPEAVDSGLLLDLIALHTTPLGTADQCSIEQLHQQYAHLSVTLPDLLQQCQDLHLLTVAGIAKNEKAKTTRLAHDTLAPLVREQFDVSDKPGQRARRILDNRSVDWEEDREGTPLDAADLAVVELGAKGTRTFTATEQRLVEASRELRARLEQKQLLLKTVGAAALAVMAITAGVALWQWSKAEVARDQAFEAREKADTNRGFARELMSGIVPEVTAATSFSESEKEELADNARKFFQAFVHEHSTEKDQPRQVLADAQYVIGRIHGEMGHFNDALGAYEKARSWQCEELGITDEDFDNVEVDRDNEQAMNDLGFTLNALGNTSRQFGNEWWMNEKDDDAKQWWETAKDWFDKAATIRKKLAGFRPKQIDYHLLHASAVMNIGLAEKNLGEFENAREYLSNADKIRRDLHDAVMNETEKPPIERHIALGNLNLALLLRKQDRIKAEALSTEAIAFYERLPKEDFSIQAELATCYEMRGQLKLEQLNNENFDPVESTLGTKPLAELEVEEASVAIIDFEKSTAICKRLFGARPWISQHQTQLTDLSFVLIDLYQPRLAIKRDKATLTKIKDLRKSIKDVDRSVTDSERENVDFLSNFGESSLEYVTLCVEIEGWKGALEILEADVRLWRELGEKHPKDSESQSVAREFLAEFLHLTAEAYISSELNAKAELAKQDALGLWQELIDASEEQSENRELYEGKRDQTQKLNTQAPAGDSG